MNTDISVVTAMWLQSPYYVDLNDRQKVIFGIICDEPGPHHVRDLARTMNVEKWVITRAHAKLREEGLVERIADPGDPRDCTLEATPHGLTVRERMRGLRRPPTTERSEPS